MSIGRFLWWKFSGNAPALSRVLRRQWPSVMKYDYCLKILILNIYIQPICTIYSQPFSSSWFACCRRLVSGTRRRTHHHKKEEFLDEEELCPESYFREWRNFVKKISTEKNWKVIIISKEIWLSIKSSDIEYLHSANLSWI